MSRIQPSSQSVWESSVIDDFVIVEEPLEIWLIVLPSALGDSTQRPLKPLLTMMRTPGDDINLVTGWLLSSGLIDSPTQIQSIHYGGQARLKGHASNQVMVTLSSISHTDLSSLQRDEVANSACGVCGQQSIDTLLMHVDQKRHNGRISCEPISLSAVTSLVTTIAEHQTLFRQTGGNHGVALFDQNLSVIDVREDVGRHNAFDKIIGANAHCLFSKNESTVIESDIIKGIGVILSGRVGFEMIQKAVMANLNYVFALGAPSSLAIELAEEADIGLVGFVKAQRFNVYSGQHLFQTKVR